MTSILLTNQISDECNRKLINAKEKLLLVIAINNELHSEFSIITPRAFNYDENMHAYLNNALLEILRILAMHNMRLGSTPLN